ncbi:Maf family nucleotide pyrophosphatase [Gleimia sp. 6138-11-ORH1]|uniref:Maf family protein n=1 Tax=Gleimia sp. 6138-11-ORH1 TaxID=2973937 RepID=UPI00216971D9|nr:nucleoside triphosphate pyrophosphatase [Gleimia sp. 6138-11-ORH1]MCS4485238.1 Maf family nucleotide pyrophosphatase [Gleimia sp. 6138-11-ORH1]
MSASWLNPELDIPLSFTRPAPSTVFVLASASSGRAGTLRRAGIEPLIRVSQVDEDAVLAKFEEVSSAEDAAEKVTALAQAKLADVVAGLDITEILEFAAAQQMPLPSKVVVVGCDSMLDVAGELVGKPHTPQVAYTRIKQLSGSRVRLFTGHAMTLLSVLPVAGATERPQYRLQVEDTLSQCESTEIEFTHLTDDEITAYIATGEPLFVAGSFTIDGLGGSFIRGVKGDPHSVVGISLPLLRSLATQLEVAWPTLWNKAHTVD